MKMEPEKKRKKKKKKKANFSKRQIKHQTLELKTDKNNCLQNPFLVNFSDNSMTILQRI